MPAAIVLAAGALSLVPWTVGLAGTLPGRYVVGTWTLTWTGFDIALTGLFAVTAWALWKQRQVAVPAAIFTSALLFCDAWFDLLTAHRGPDLTVSAVTAVFGEIPIAIGLAVIATRLLRNNLRPLVAVGSPATPRSLWRAPLTAAVPTVPAERRIDRRPIHRSYHRARR